MIRTPLKSYSSNIFLISKGNKNKLSKKKKGNKNKIKPYLKEYEASMEKPCECKSLKLSNKTMDSH